MRPKIRYDLLLKSQKNAGLIKHPIKLDLYDTAYKFIYSMRQGVLRQFPKICIHGNHPQLLIKILQQSNQSQANNNNKYWIHSHIWDQKLTQNQNIQFLNPQKPFNQLKTETNFDLIISCLQTHHYELPNLLQNYLRRLNPDGAVIGCTWLQNTLKQLKWAYMMAQNERYGGMSPKVYGFPGTGTFGHHMTACNMKLSTIVIKDIEVQVESMVDVITLMEIMGESGSLHGRRKGCYKDLLLAASAYYDSQFLQKLQNNQQIMGIFIGWKQHQSQQKPLRPQKVINKSFFEEIMGEDKTAKMFQVNQGNQQPNEVDLKQLKQRKNDPKS